MEPKRGLAALLALGLVGCFGAPGYVTEAPMPNAPFDGVRFYNLTNTDHTSLPRVLKWQATRRPVPWGPPTLDLPPGEAPPQRVDGLRVTFVNHSTFLIQTAGLNLLTDPVWSERVSPVTFAGPKRQRPPGLRFEDLPPIDVVLLSHNHYDHLDAATLKRLEAAHHPLFLSGLGNLSLLKSLGLSQAQELDWWDEVALSAEVTSVFVPAQHFSGRGLTDRDRTLWGGFALKAPAGMILFAGDTGLGAHFQTIRERLGPPRLAILPIGAYRPEWFMSGVHMGPDDAVEAHQRLGAAQSVGMHFGTFPLADEGRDEPIEGLRLALQRRGLPPDVFVVPPHGEGLTFPTR